MVRTATIRHGIKRFPLGSGAPWCVRLMRACLLVVAVAAFGLRAYAQSNQSTSVREQVYSVGLAVTNIYQVNSTNGTVSTVFTNYPGGGAASAAAAQRASDGLIFYIGNFGNTNQPVFTWNPATPATAPVQIGTTGAGIPYIPRLAFTVGGV